MDYPLHAKKIKTVSTRTPYAHYLQLKAIAKKENVSVSALINNAINEFLEKERWSCK